MTLADFYLFCFGFGFLFSVVAFVTGHLNLDFGGADVDAGLDAPSADVADHSVSPFNFGTIAAFLAWFGGAGYLMTKFYRLWFVTTLGAALLAGLSGGLLVYLFLAKVLMRSREEMNPADYDMIGVLGVVTATIRQGGLGEIMFSQNGTRRAAPATCEDQVAIASGTEVVVTRYEGGIAYVRRWEDLAGSH